MDRPNNSDVSNPSAADNWLGNSRALKQLFCRLQKYAMVDLPVLIEGEKGTGKSLAAATIHQYSSRHSCPFVECNCLQIETNAENIIREHYLAARTGTLYLRNVNVLPTLTVKRLSPMWEREYMGVTIETRIICAMSKEFSDQQLKTSAAPWLPLQMPTLADRIQDIPFLVEMLLSKFAHIRTVELDEACYQVLMAHTWQDNVKGLERAIAILSVMAERQRMDLVEMLDILPELCPSATPAQEPSQFVMLSEQDTKKTQDPPIHLGSESSQSSDEVIVSMILDDNTEQLPDYHSALNRSLSEIAKRYHQKITLEEVAKSVFVSSPHLSHLYRKHLGITFKQLLIKVRIEQSKRLLVHKSKMQITQISYEVGFHDLSHFEKAFRRLVGIKPLQFRQRKIH